MNQKGISSIVIILIIVGVLIIVGGVWYWQSQVLKQPVQPPTIEQPITEQPTTEQQPTDETANWKTYRNEKQGFEIKFPPVGKWDYTVWADKKSEMGRPAFFDASFKVSEKENNISFRIRINLFSEVTPLFPPWPVCRKDEKDEGVRIWDSNFPYVIYSSYDPKVGADIKECDSFSDRFLLDEHSAEVRLCVSKEIETYSPDLTVIGKEIGGEYSYYCREEGDPLYYLALYCKGKNWQGKEGRDECNKLFNQILSTFKFIK